MKCTRDLLLAAAVLFMTVSPVVAVIEFNDGQVHEIDYEINDDVWVDYESPGVGTTLNILDGAAVPFPYRLEGWEESIINMSGGSVNRLKAYDGSRAIVAGGSITGSLAATMGSQVTVCGGAIEGVGVLGARGVSVSGGSIGAFSVFGSSEVTISGGSIDTWILITGDSEVAVSGGDVDVLLAGGSSQVIVSGGAIGGDFGMLNPGYGVVELSENAVFTISGSGFAVDGTLVGYTEVSSVYGGEGLYEPVRRLTGTLLSGELIDTDFRIGHDATIVLIPEPASILLLGLGGLFLEVRGRRR